MSIYPKIFRVRQTLESQRVDDIPGTVHAELSRLALQKVVKPGQTVAISAGSRGIANIAVIIKAAVEYFQSIGAKPFIVPAMGSHGGGTAQGQQDILHGYGITEAYCGCPIKSSMETVVVSQAKEGFPVHFDKHAYEADHVLVCGRVKPHTDFVGDIESGLMKMMLIGLGKHNGARTYHAAIHDYSFPQIVRSVAKEVLAKCHVVAGLGIVENGYEQTAKIQAVNPQELEDREKELLVLAKKLMPKLPFPLVDILLVDQIGKNISGAGMDTNIVGRKYDDHKAVEQEYPKVRRIVVRGLTPETHGNAAGIGMAEFCTTRTVQQIDLNITRINCITAGHVSGCMLPVDFESDRIVLDQALPTIGLTPPEKAKILWIKNTLDLREVECSDVFYEEAKGRKDLEVISPLRELPFDALGNLPDSMNALVNGASAH